jgi:hypothetical protein
MQQLPSIVTDTNVLRRLQNDLRLKLKAVFKVRLMAHRYSSNAFHAGCSDEDAHDYPSNASVSARFAYETKAAAMRDRK